MGRDTYLYIFVGRKCTDEEKSNILKQIDDPDYADFAHINELNADNPTMEIDDCPVVLIYADGDETWYVCEKLIGIYDIEYQKEPIELDFSKIKIQNNKHKLLLVSEISF
jgi:hypothetical protein